ncbi:40S ribosomal protein s16 [Phtheirospermum japonicum]|uniref:40S ribosomal protein s16 n=1 Tax=Phtheirospermum japonicum TaxID=374723 RepID=A0A830D8V1_9LAMI|nr:40S ribosomal protein s16 [Phtheirospermum japonicum]
MAEAIESVQCFGRKKTAITTTHCKRGRDMINSTAFQSSSCARRFSDSRLLKLSSSSAATDSPESTCAFTSRAAVTPSRSTPFASPSRRR